MPALIFDLDGTLVDTVYAHVFSWQKALQESGMAVDGWRIHRKIGMSGGLFTRAVGREIGHELTDEEAEELQRIHDRLFRELLPPEERRPLPGAKEILRGAARARHHARDRDLGPPPRDRRLSSTRSRSPTTWSSSSAATSPAPSRSRTCSSSAPAAWRSSPRTAT